MTTRTTTTVHMGINPGNPSDVTNYVVDGGNDEVDVVHESTPDGVLTASGSGARLHLVGFADTVEGTPYVPEIPSVGASNPILPDVEAVMGATDGTYADNTTFTNADAGFDKTKTQMLAIDLTWHASAPSGLIFEQGDSTDGAYVGWVNNKLVIRQKSGADLRINATPYHGETGTLYVEFNINGSVSAWWAEEDVDVQRKFLGTQGGTPGDWFGAAGNGAAHRAANGTANIEGGSATNPTVRDAEVTRTFASSFSANMCTHVADDLLIAIVSMHPYGGDNLVDANISGWSRVLDHDGGAGSYAPTCQVFTRKATGANHTASVTCTGATNRWEKTVQVISAQNCSHITATLGEVLNGGFTEIDFPAGVGSPPRVLHGLITSTSEYLSVPGSDTFVDTSHGFLRGQYWTTSTSTAAILNHPIQSYPAHTSVTLNMFGDNVGEGTGAANGTLDNAIRVWKDTSAPSNMMDVGTYGDPGHGTISAVDAEPYIPGSSSAVYTEATSGYYLESVAVRLKQSRSGAGLWGARLFALTAAGEYVYGPPLRPPFDVPETGDVGDRLLTAQPALGTGKSWHDAVTESWSVGLLLESRTEDTEAAYGTARLDVAEAALTWVIPPQITLLYPLAGTVLPTVTPPVGWSIADGDTQTAYRVRVWETSSFDPSMPDSGRIAFDSGKQFSQTVRSAQVTRPLRPELSYTIGVMLEGETVNGRIIETSWTIVEVTTPGPATILELEADRVTATANADGSVDLTGGAFAGQPGTWAMVERANAADLDAAAADDPGSYVAHETWWNHSKGWTATVPSGVVAPTADDGLLTVEMRGTWWIDDVGAVDQYLLAHAYTTTAEGGVAVWFDATGGVLTVGLRDTAALRTVKPGQTEWDSVFTDGRPIWFRMTWNLAATTEAVIWETTLDGATWTTFDTTNAAALITGPDTVPNADETVLGGRRDPTTTIADGTPGYIRHAKIVNTTAASIERLLLDIDVDRDSDGDETVGSIQDPTTGMVFSPAATSGGAGLKRVGGTPAIYLRRVATSGAPFDTVGEGNSGVSSTGLPARLTGMDWAFFGMEWWGVIPNDPDGTNFRTLFQITDGGTDLKVNLYVNAGTYGVRLELQDSANLSRRTQVSNTNFEGYWGRWLGIRIDGQGATEGIGSAFWVTSDDGQTWQLLEVDTTFAGSAAATMTVEPAVASDVVTLMGDTQNDTHHLPGYCEKFRLWSFADNEMIIDVDLSRDVVDITESSFVDILGMTWTLQPGSNFLVRGSKRVIPPGQADDLWKPVVGLRELAVGNVNSNSDPRVRFVDPAPPQHEQVLYRMRLVDEPTATFEALSTDWAESGPVTVQTDSWWLATLNGSRRFELHPTSGGWNQERPGSTAAGIGRSGNVTTRDVLKDRIVQVECLTTTQAELDTFRTIIDTGDALFLSDVHGRSSIVQPTGTIQTTPVRGRPKQDETAPVGRMYATVFELTEVEDPRDFGFGTNLAG